MSPHHYAVVVAVLITTSLITALTAATPPRPGEELNGLTPNETATLWSRDSDDYITQSEYEQRYGDERSAMAQLANGTDITFKRPPHTAATWTRNDFQDLTPGNETTSVHPPNANLTNGTFIADAHASIFAIHPSTRAHRSPGATHATSHQRARSAGSSITASAPVMQATQPFSPTKWRKSGSSSMASG